MWRNTGALFPLCLPLCLLPHSSSVSLPASSSSSPPPRLASALLITEHTDQRTNLFSCFSQSQQPSAACARLYLKSHRVDLYKVYVCEQSSMCVSERACVCGHVTEQVCVCVCVHHTQGNKFHSEVRARKGGGIGASMGPAFPKCFSHINPFLVPPSLSFSLSLPHTHT